MLPPDMSALDGFAGEPVCTAPVQVGDAGPLEPGHVEFDLVADAGLDVGQVAVAFGKLAEQIHVEHRTEMAESVRLMIRDGFTGPTGLTPEQIQYVGPLAAVPVGLALGAAS